jgi:aspartate carbamoyltransferase catalytic subunit
MRNRLHEIPFSMPEKTNTNPPVMTEQLDPSGRLRHLLTLDGLSREVLVRLLDRAQQLHGHAHGGSALRATLAGKAVCNLFFEPSTRTRSSFQLAAMRWYCIRGR